MNFNTRFSQLLATVLGALALMFSSADASAQESPVVGTLTFARGCTVYVNGKKQASGYQVHAGDAIKTSASCKAQVRLIDGGTLAIKQGTRVRVYLEANTVVAAVLIGGVDYIPAVRPGPGTLPVIVDLENSSRDAEPLPFLAAFGFGNFSFPSIGGGSSSSTGKIPVLNASGVVIGYALTDSSGKVIAYTDLSGKVLAVSAPNGTPVSSVFGQGAVLL